MTDAERSKIKEDLKKVIVSHFESFGFPNITIEQMIGLLPGAWQKICDAGLYREGMSYQAFVEHAYNSAMIAQVLGISRMSR